MAHRELNLRERRAIEDMLNAKISVKENAAQIGTACRPAQSDDRAAQRRMVTGTDRRTVAL